MNHLTYARGEGWLVVAAGRGLAWLDVADEDGRVVEVLTTLRAGAGVASVLDILSRDGLPATPSFVIAEWDAGILTILVRGGASVTVSSEAGEETVTASRISTWAERVFDAPQALALALDEGSGGAVAHLELAEGVARGVMVSLDAAVDRPVTAPSSKRGGRAKRATVVEEAPLGVVNSAPQPVVPPVPASQPEFAADSPSPDVDETIAVTDLVDDEPHADHQTESAGTDDHEISLHDELFGATVVRSVEEAAVRAPTEPVAVATESLDATDDDADYDADHEHGDHDGETIFGAQLASLLEGGVQHQENKPVRAEPAPFVLRSSSGETISLARPVMIGRLPSVSSLVASGELPDLISVAGSNPDVSRNHVRVTVEGGTVVVTDLHSRNGTTCTLPGKQPSRLRAGDPTPVIIGTVVDLGGGATYTVDRP